MRNWLRFVIFFCFVATRVGNCHEQILFPVASVGRLEGKLRLIRTQPLPAGECSSPVPSPRPWRHLMPASLGVPAQVAIPIVAAGSTTRRRAFAPGARPTNPEIRTPADRLAGRTGQTPSPHRSPTFVARASRRRPAWPRGPQAYSTVRRGARREHGRAYAMHRRPQQEVGERCGLGTGGACRQARACNLRANVR